MGGTTDREELRGGLDQRQHHHLVKRHERWENLLNVSLTGRSSGLLPYVRATVEHPYSFSTPSCCPLVQGALAGVRRLFYAPIYCMAIPPSTWMLWPVMLRASSDARKTAKLPMSSGVCSRCSGVFALHPGFKQFTRFQSGKGWIPLRKPAVPSVARTDPRPSPDKWH